jgi:hypothetical protein
VVKLTASDGAGGDYFGVSVAISGDTVVAGAYGDDSWKGAAYVFDRDQGGADNWDQVAKLTASDGAADDHFGVSVAISGDTVVVGAHRGDSIQGAAYVFARDQGGADNWGQVAKLTASDGTGGDYFGYSVAISGDTVVVGAYLDDDQGDASGSAYVFARNQDGADNWGRLAKLTARDGAADDYFGYSVAISGNSIVIGAIFDDDQGDSSGSAYVRSGDLWGQRQKRTHDGAADDCFGYSVAINGDIAVVGAYGVNSNQGAAYVFERDQGGADNWGQVVKLTASDGAANDRFGRSVAISGEVIVAGAYLDDDQGDASGSAYVFGRDQGGADNWGQVAKLTASDGAANDYFGTAVAINSDTVVVGADGDDSDQGAAYVFGRDQGGADNWGQVVKLTASDGATDDQFGYSVAINGDTVVVGARGDAYDRGAAYVFAWDQGGADNWGQVIKLTASDGAASDWFGWSVAISGDTVVVGARGDDLSKGAAYVFDRDQGGANNWGQVVKLTASDGATGDQFGRFVAISGDTAVVGADGDDSDKGSAYVYEQTVSGAPPAGPVYLPIILKNH